VRRSGRHPAPFVLRYGAILERFCLELSIKGVPEEQVALLRERAKANHRSLQGELRALIDAAINVQPRRLSIEEIVANVGKLRSGAATKRRG
jgi:plasmid stability protein